MDEFSVLLQPPNPVRERGSNIEVSNMGNNENVKQKYELLLKKLSELVSEIDGQTGDDVQ